MPFWLTVKVFFLNDSCITKWGESSELKHELEVICLTHWDVVVEIFWLCIGVQIHACVHVCACMRVYVHVHLYVYVFMCVCLYVFIYMYIHARACVHMHSCRRVLFICTVQSLYYMRVYHKCFLNTCMHGWEGIGSGFFFQLVHG